MYSSTLKSDGNRRAKRNRLTRNLLWVSNYFFELGTNKERFLKYSYSLKLFFQTRELTRAMRFTEHRKGFVTSWNLGRKKMENLSFSPLSGTVFSRFPSSVKQNDNSCNDTNNGDMSGKMSWIGKYVNIENMRRNVRVCENRPLRRSQYPKKPVFKPIKDKIIQKKYKEFFLVAHVTRLIFENSVELSTFSL